MKKNIFFIALLGLTFSTQTYGMEQKEPAKSVNWVFTDGNGIAGTVSDDVIQNVICAYADTPTLLLDMMANSKKLCEIVTLYLQNPTPENAHLFTIRILTTPHG